MSNMWTGFIGWRVMQEGMYYWRHVVVVAMYFMRICARAGYA